MSRSRKLAGVAVCAAVAGAGWLALARPASAHHSFALFDHVHRITVTGTVVKFDWTNPHVYIHLRVPEGPTTRAYTVECASPNVLTRVGWKYGDIKTGDRVSLLINPLRDGKPGGMLERATLADGRTLSDGNPPGGVFPIERQLPAKGSAP
ncbi:MAG: DUF6152 family protein [Steroidobacteraceae bacterium]